MSIRVFPIYVLLGMIAVWGYPHVRDTITSVWHRRKKP